MSLAAGTYRRGRRHDARQGLVFLRIGERSVSRTGDTVVGVDVRTTSYVYEGWANDPWPVVIYDISISRKSQFYDIFLIVIVIFGLLSSFPAFMSPEVGERLGYGITFLLIIEVSKMTFVSVLPMCGEILWVDLLFISSELVSLVALAETCVVLFLNYYTHKHIVPPWIFAVGAHVRVAHRARGVRRRDALGRGRRARRGRGEVSLSPACYTGARGERRAARRRAAATAARQPTRALARRSRRRTCGSSSSSRHSSSRSTRPRRAS